MNKRDKAITEALRGVDRALRQLGDSDYMEALAEIVEPLRAALDAKEKERAE